MLVTHHKSWKLILQYCALLVPSRKLQENSLPIGLTTYFNKEKWERSVINIFNSLVLYF